MLAPASNATCVDSTCSATVIGTAGLSDFCGSDPVIATQIYKFVAPGLYKNERQAFAPYLAATPIFFLLGAALVFFFAMPVLMKFSIGMQQAATDGQVFSTECLSELLPDAAALTDLVAGVLIIPLSQRPRDFLFYFRKEAVQTLDWAGDPNKTYDSGPFGDRLTPRKSFAIWKETVRGRSHAWSASDLGFAEAVRSSVVEVLLFKAQIETALAWMVHLELIALLALPRLRAQLKQQGHDQRHH